MLTADNVRESLVPGRRLRRTFLTAPPSTPKLGRIVAVYPDRVVIRYDGQPMNSWFTLPSADGLRCLPNGFEIWDGDEPRLRYEFAT